MNYCIVKNEEQYSAVIGDAVSAALNKGIRERGRAVFLGVGGASIPISAWRRALSALLVDGAVWCGVADDRCPLAHRNTAPLAEQLNDLHVRWIAPAKSETPAKMAAHYEHGVIAACGGIFHPDAVALGLGDRPLHFASLVEDYRENSPLQCPRTGYVAVHQFPDKPPPERITITLAGILSCQSLVFGVLPARSASLAALFHQTRPGSGVRMLRDVFTHPNGVLVVHEQTAAALGAKDGEKVTVS